MVKRIMVSVIGAGMGSLVGLLVSSMGVGNSALIICGILGAVLPHLVLGTPGH